MNSECDQSNEEKRETSNLFKHYNSLLAFFLQIPRFPRRTLYVGRVLEQPLSSDSAASTSIKSSASAEALFRINCGPISIASETSKKNDALTKQKINRALAQVSIERQNLCIQFLRKHYCAHRRECLFDFLFLL